ncbi:MAG: DUF1385 domain-containing protein [Candidatus Bathyarchaeota archaeon]|nr:MAG: DUF1385 domain-containing protein [Candidatus Bathyarchaeota archaeon]
MEDKDKSLVLGGQAVIEGVMIRSRSHMIISVRKPNGVIHTISEKIDPISEKYRLLQLPFIRGILAMFETLFLGFKSLFHSANIALEEEGVKLSYKEIVLTIGMILAVSSFFIVIPLSLAALFTATGLIFNLVEGVVRLIFFLMFLKVVSFWSEYERVLQYHGAEHKAINAYEAGAS